MIKINKKVEFIPTFFFLLMGLLFLTMFSSFKNAQAATINEGDTIKTASNPDVYIVKYVGDKKFRRLILNPKVFESYKHLSWSKIKIVNQAEMNSFVVSDLVRATDDSKVYKLIPSGDTGSKHWVNMTSAQFNAYAMDWDSIYQINKTDRDNYVTGSAITQMQWRSVGDEGFSPGSALIISFTFDPVTENPFIAFRDAANGEKSTVMKFNGISWQIVGQPGFSSGLITAISLNFHPPTGEPYVAYVDVSVGNGKATVMKFNGTNWQTVGSSGFSQGLAQYISLAFNPLTNEPYVAFADGSSENKATVMKFNGSLWQIVGSAGFSPKGVISMNLAFNPSTNEPYIAYQDAENFRAVVMKFNGTNWEAVPQVLSNGLTGGTAYIKAFAFNPVTKEPNLLFSGQDQKAELAKFNGLSWQFDGLAPFNEKTFGGSIAFNRLTGSIYLAFGYEYYGKATVLYQSGASWQVLGVAEFTNDMIFYPILAFHPSSNEPYLAFSAKANANKATVMKFYNW